MITPENEALFAKRFKGPHMAGSMAYAKAQACAYAERYAAGMPEWVAAGIAALHFRYTAATDVGDRVLLRLGIDCLLAVGRACADD